MNWNLQGKAAVVTGAGGAICGEIASALAGEGVRVALWDISEEAASARRDLIAKGGGEVVSVTCDATSRKSVAEALDRTVEAFGTVDILINGAGGGRPETTTSDSLSFFDFEPEDMQRVIALNYLSAVIPSQAVGRMLAEKKRGAVVNISSAAGLRPVTRALSYSDGKAATVSFTRWLAVHMAQTYSPDIRVNTIAPGFVITTQNRFLLVDEATGELTERGRSVIERVPMGRFGEPREIVGAALWLVSDWASFVTGAVITTDGGFTAYAGV